MERARDVFSRRLLLMNCFISSSISYSGYSYSTSFEAGRGGDDVKVFIGGARGIKHFNDEVKSKLHAIAKREVEVLLGDASGVDYAVQDFFKKIGYKKIVIYASGGKVRNNIGDWEVVSITVDENVYGYEFYKQKDIAMANDSDYGFMIWNGKSRGTLNNMVNLTKQKKTCMVYLEPKNKIFTLEKDTDLQALLLECPENTNKNYNKLIVQD